MNSIQNIKTNTYKSNSDVLKRNDSPLMSRRCNSDQGIAQKCSCPKILSCDDDVFQHFIIEKLLRAKISESCETQSKTKSFTCGEDLIKQYIYSTAICKCEGPGLIVTDFYMGEGKMNGIQVIAKLRKLGFSGTLILRSSNNRESLTEIVYSEGIEERVDEFIFISKNEQVKRQKDILFSSFHGQL